MEPHKYDYIDALRGIAIMMVVMVHVYYDNNYYENFPVILRNFFVDGQLGVQLFFLVSAYTLMLSHQSRAGEEHWIHKFYLRRLFRIIPVYYLGILYFSFQNITGFRFFITGESINPYPFGSLLANLFFIHDFFPSTINNLVPGGWSIGVEMSFYLFFPLLVHYLNSFYRSFFFFLLASFFSIFLNIWLKGSSLDTNYYLYLWFPNNLPVFALGILAYYLTNNNKRVRIINSNLYLCVLILFGFIGLYFDYPKHILYSIGFLGLLVLFKNKKTISLRPIVYLGTISYSVYLLHFAVLSLVHRVGVMNIFDGMNYWFVFVIHYILVLVVSSLIASFSYKYIEKPFVSLGKIIIDRYGK